MPGKGLEPSRRKAPDPKSGVSANSTTRAKKTDPYRMLEIEKKQKANCLKNNSTS
jgi:hypothetical protein